MTQFLFLNLLLAVFLAATVWEFRVKQKPLPVSSTITKRLPPWILGIVLIVFFFFVLGLILYASKSFMFWYVHGAFAVLVVGHARWLGRTQSLGKNVLLHVVALLILAFRFLFPSEISHNLLIFISIVWLGPFLTKIGLLTAKRFVLISLFWFLYDIFFVWLTPASGELIDRTSTIGFPLAIIFDGSFIGTGDLLWANLFVSILTKRNMQFLGIAILVFSNTVLGLYDYATGNESVFPLLVLWVPIGLLLLHLSSQFIINRGTGNNEHRN